MSYDGFLLTQDIKNPKRGPKAEMPYDLFEGDLLAKNSDGVWWKICPGLAIGGFQFTEEQLKLLRPVRYDYRDLDYVILEGESA